MDSWAVLHEARVLYDGDMQFGGVGHMNQARGIYQPMAEKVPLYDLADEEIDEERSRVPLLIVIALVVLAAFAGVVWLAYNQGVARGRAGGSIVIQGVNEPERLAPQDAGGLTPNTGVK